MLGNDGRMRQHHTMHPMNTNQQQHPVLPTYKWMQVKRNIPKPTGKYFLSFNHQNWFLYPLMTHFCVALSNNHQKPPKRLPSN